MSEREACEGPNIGEVVDEGRKFDSTWFWMYGGNAYSHAAEDVIGPRYPTPLCFAVAGGRLASLVALMGFRLWPASLGLPAAPRSTL